MAGCGRQLQQSGAVHQRRTAPLSDFLIARGRALARFGRGERDAPLLAGLLKLRDEAVACELNVALPALEKAIGALQ